MPEEKTGEGQTDELAGMLEILREKAKMQDGVVAGLQKLIRKEGLSFGALNRLPYPAAIFAQDGALVFVNDALSEETGLCSAGLLKGKHNIINRITDRNFVILDAVEHVFAGETSFLNDLYDLLELFTSDASCKMTSPDYRSAIFFPLVKAEGKIIHGAAVFFKNG